MTDNFLASVVSTWEKVIERSRLAKHRQFGKTADRAWAFLGQDYDGLYIDARDDRGEKFPYAEGAVWKTRRNLSREYVAVMLPYIHAKIPNRLVLSRRQGLPPELLELAAKQNPDVAPAIGYADAMQKMLEPTDKLRAHLLKEWLNYLPQENDLYGEQRRGLQEALVMGRAVVWHEMRQSPYGLIPMTSFDSVRGLYCDPDARSWRDQNFIIRQRCESVIRTAKKFGLPRSELRGKDNRGLTRDQTQTQSAGADLRPPMKDQGDTIIYYEIYSRVGIGSQFDNPSEELKELSGAMDAFGDHVYLAVAQGVPYPLNLPPESVAGGIKENLPSLKELLKWPIPFHADATDPWPCSVLDFMPSVNDPWATSPLEGCLALLAFIDHGYTYLLSRIRTTCRNLFVASKALGEKFITQYLHGTDLELLLYDGAPGEELDKLIKRIDFPEFKRDLLIVIDKAEQAFAQASGMVPPMYGGAPETQDRSATATQARESRLSSRPNDFADCVEAWNSRIASKEALASRLYVGKEVMAAFYDEPETKVPDPNLPPEAVAMAEQTGQKVPMISVPGPLTTKWMELVQVGSAEMTPEELAAAAYVAATELQYTVEAGSGRRKNRQKQAEDWGQLTQVLLPTFVQLATSGQPKPYDWLMGMARDVFDISVDGALWPKEPPPAQNQPDPEQEAAAQAQQQDMEMQRGQQEQDAAAKEQEMMMQQGQKQQEMMMQDAQHAQEMQHREQSHAQDMEMKKAQAQAAKRRPQK